MRACGSSTALAHEVASTVTDDRGPVYASRAPRPAAPIAASKPLCAGFLTGTVALPPRATCACSSRRADPRVRGRHRHAWRNASEPGGKFGDGPRPRRHRTPGRAGRGRTPEVHAECHRGRFRWTRHRHVALRPRRRERLQQGPARRHSPQRTRWRVQLQQPDDRLHLERIEVVRGAMSALFGSDAMSSVIQLFSARGRPGARPRVTASVEGGSYATARTQAGVSGGVGRWDYAIAGGRFGTDNRVPNNVFDNTTLAITAGGPLDAGERLTLRTVVRLERQHVGVPGQTAFGRPDSDAFFDRNDVVAGVSIEHRTSTRWQTAGGILGEQLHPGFNESLRRPALHTNVRRPRGALPVLRLHARYQERAASLLHQLPERLASGGWHVDWRAADRHGRARHRHATRDAEGYARAHATTGVARQLRGHTAAPTCGRPVVDHGRPPRRTQRELRHCRRPARVVGVPRPSTRRNVRRHDGPRERGPRRERADDPGVVQPELLLPRKRRPAPGTLDVLRLGARTAPVRPTCEGRTDVVRRAIPESDFDEDARLHDVQRPVLQHWTHQRRAVPSSLVETQPVEGLHLRAGHTFLASEIVESTSPSSAVFREGAWTFRRPRHSGYLRSVVHPFQARGRSVRRLLRPAGGQRLLVARTADHRIEPASDLVARRATP